MCRGFAKIKNFTIISHALVIHPFRKLINNGRSTAAEVEHTLGLFLQSMHTNNLQLDFYTAFPIYFREFSSFVGTRSLAIDFSSF